MEKRDMIVIIVAIVIVLVMAMYIKPLVTGKEPKIIPDEISGMLFGSNNTENISQNNTVLNNSQNLSGLINNSSSENIKTKLGNETVNISNNTNEVVSPIPTQWNGSPVQIGYNYSSISEGIIPKTGPISEDQVYSFLQKPNMSLFSEFKGNRSISSDIFEIPNTIGYWEIEYTVDYKSGLQDVIASEEVEDYPVFKFNQERKTVIEDGVSVEKIISKGGAYSEEDYSGTGEFVESYSISTPSIVIQVIQHNHEGSKIIKTITPDGGLDPYLWNKELIKTDLKQKSKISGKELDDDVLEERVKYVIDPRPWHENIYERGNFSLIIQPKNLISYDVKINVSKGRSSLNDKIKEDSVNPLIETLDNYIQKYNLDLKSSDYFPNLLNLVSIHEENKNQIIQQIYQTKLNVPHISRYSVYSTDMTSLNIRGDIYYDLNGQEKWMPLDVYFIYNNKWQLENPILPKY